MRHRTLPHTAAWLVAPVAALGVMLSPVGASAQIASEPLSAPPGITSAPSTITPTPATAPAAAPAAPLAPVAPVARQTVEPVAPVAPKDSSLLGHSEPGSAQHSPSGISPTHKLEKKKAVVAKKPVKPGTKTASTEKSKAKPKLAKPKAPAPLEGGNS